MSEKDGESAFPVSYGSGGEVWIASSGMSLRDYFAGQVLVGLWASPKALAVIQQESDKEGLPADRYMARCAYDAADVMLIVRGE